MLIDSSKMSMMDISRFVNEAKISREYKDFIIETESYVLMTKPMFERLMQISDNHRESTYPEKRYRRHGKYRED